MRSMFSVVTPMIWVSPRSNSDEPWVSGTTPTSADRRRMSDGRTSVDPDLVAQDALAHELLGQRAERRVDLLLATLELARRPSRSTRSEMRDVSVSRSCLPAMVRACGELCRRRLLDGGEDVVLVVEVSGELTGRLGSHRGKLGLRLAEHADERLGGLETLRDDLFGRGGGAASDQVDRLFGGLGLDHHDRDVGLALVLDDAAGDDHVEDGALELGVRREADPLAVDESDANAADRTAERQCRRAGSTSRPR